MIRIFGTLLYRRVSWELFFGFFGMVFVWARGLASLYGCGSVGKVWNAFRTVKDLWVNREKCETLGILWGLFKASRTFWVIWNVLD